MNAFLVIVSDSLLFRCIKENAGELNSHEHVVKSLILVLCLNKFRIEQKLYT